MRIKDFAFEDKEGCPNIWRFHFWQNPFLGCPKIKASRIAFWHFPTLIFLGKKGGIYEEKNYKGAKVSKRVVAKCEGVYRTYDAIQYAYANLLSETEEVKSFQVNVLLQGLEEGAYTSDFVIAKADGNLMVRECVSRKHLTKPMTPKLLDASRNYWKSHGIPLVRIIIRHKNSRPDLAS